MRVRRGLTPVVLGFVVAAGISGGVATAALPPFEASPDGSAPVRAADAGRAIESSTAPAASLPTVRVRQRSSAVAGKPVSYLIEVRNPGDEQLRNVAVHQLLPPVVGHTGSDPEPVAESTEQLRWVVSLPPGETVRFRTHGVVSGKHTTFWNRIGIGARPRVGTTACVAPVDDGAVSDCDTALAEAGVVVPWWRTWYVLAGCAFGASVGVVAGIVWFRRKRSAHSSSPLSGRT